MYDTSKIIAERDAREAAEAPGARDVTVAARASSGSKVHAMWLRNSILFCRSNVAGMGTRLHNVELRNVDCKNCITHLEAGW
jgi:hypothetical protein